MAARSERLSYSEYKNTTEILYIRSRGAFCFSSDGTSWFIFLFYNCVSKRPETRVQCKIPVSTPRPIGWSWGFFHYYCFDVFIIYINISLLPLSGFRNGGSFKAWMRLLIAFFPPLFFWIRTENGAWQDVRPLSLSLSWRALISMYSTRDLPPINKNKWQLYTCAYPPYCTAYPGRVPLELPFRREITPWAPQIYTYSISSTLHPTSILFNLKSITTSLLTFSIRTFPRNKTPSFLDWLHFKRKLWTGEPTSNITTQRQTFISKLP